MGKRKKLAADARKEARKAMSFAKAQNVPSSPRKMRYVVDLVRGMEVNRALGTLKFCAKAASADVEKVLRSAIANWDVTKQVNKSFKLYCTLNGLYTDGTSLYAIAWFQLADK